MTAPTENEKPAAAPPRVEILSTRKVPHTIEVVEADPKWPEIFELLKERIMKALGPTALLVEHVGSTSVPNMVAKPVIDMDLVVADIQDEAYYVPRLEEAGFQFLLRSQPWHNHRLFCLDEPNVNLHVFGDDLREVNRHCLFRDWLRKTREDREIYAKIKKESSLASQRLGEDVNQYNARKSAVMKEILGRAYRDFGCQEDCKLHVHYK